MKTSLLFLIPIISLFGTNNIVPSHPYNVNNNFFIENKGQWPSEVKYLAKVGGMNAWITNAGVVYDYFKVNRNFNEAETIKMPRNKKQEFEVEHTSIKGHIVKMCLVEANTNPLLQGNNKQEGYYNYIIGNDKTKWASFVPLYRDIEVNNIFKGINIKYYFEGNSIRYDYILKPGSDLTLLKLKFEGQESIRINETGELIIKTSLGEVTNGKLFSYQNDNGTKIEIACRFVQTEDGTISIKAVGYDKTKELIIDPLVYSTFIGGNDMDDIYSIKIDDEGNAFLAGYTLSANYPTTIGSYQTTEKGFYDAIITKLNSLGSGLIFSTFLGGSDKELSYSIAIDITGNSYLTGETASSNFPTTAGAYQTNYGGGKSDVFITKLNTSGSSLVYSTYLGGNDYDGGNSIAIDKAGNVFITGQTNSLNYPVSPDAFQKTNRSRWSGVGDAFITKLNSNGNELIYSTYIGGNNIDCGYSIAVDLEENAFITGSTNSTNFPVSPGAFQSNNNGSSDAFVVKLNPTGSNLIFSTLLGGNKNDGGFSLVIDSLGNSYITGFTGSINFPITSGAFQTIYINPNSNQQDIFVTKLNPNGNELVYSTYLGGNNEEFAGSIAIDKTGNAYITGYSTSDNFPVTPGAFQTSIIHNYRADAIVTKLNPNGSGLVYSTFIGGEESDQGNSIAIDIPGNIFISGNTWSSNFPITPGVFQTKINGEYHDSFVTKLNIAPDHFLLTSPLGGENWKAGDSKKIAWGSSGISEIKIQYSTDLGLSWNLIINSYPASQGSYSWMVPFNLSAQCLIKLSVAADSTIFIANTDPFRIWYPITNVQNPVVGQNHLNFEQANVFLDLVVNNPGQITSTYYEFEAPQTGPNSIYIVGPYYWKISASDSLNFSNGFIKVPYSVISGMYGYIAWLKRTNPGEAWTDIGGLSINGYFQNTVPFSSFSEFAIGNNPYLPVELTELTATVNYEKVNLIWSTITETNNRGFEIQRRSSTYDFRTIAFVKGNGTTTQVNNYSWTEKLQPGNYFYRLKQIDFDGNLKYSKVVEVTVAPKNFSLEQNFPNPFNPVTSIRYNVPVECSINIKVYNALGEIVHEYNQGIKQSGFYELNFNSAGMASGVYFYLLQAVSTDGKKDFSAVKKMMLLK